MGIVMAMRPAIRWPRLLWWPLLLWRRLWPWRRRRYRPGRRRCWLRSALVIRFERDSLQRLLRAIAASVFILAGCGTLLRRLRHTVLIRAADPAQPAKPEGIAHGLIDLGAVAPLLWWKSH